MRTLVFWILVCSLLAGCATPKKPEPVLETDEQKTVYAVGVRMADMLNHREFSEEELEVLELGLADRILGKDLKVDMDAINPKVNTLMATRATDAWKKEKELGDAFCADLAQEEGARPLPSGATYIEIEPGQGPSPEPGDNVKVHYHGTLRDGSVFDSTVDRDMPATFNVNRVVKCFGEGLLEMKVGGKAKLVCPPDTAYGAQGSPPRIRPGAALVFDVELLEIAE